MGCENGNFDNIECKNETPKNTSAKDFVTLVKNGKEIKDQEKKDPNILPQEADFDKAFNFTQQVNGPKLGNVINPNASKNVPLPKSNPEQPKNGINIGQNVTTGPINGHNINIGVQR